MQAPGTTPQRQPAATSDDSDGLHIEFSRLLCDEGHSASSRDGAGKPRIAAALTAGPLQVWMLHRVCRK